MMVTDKDYNEISERVYNVDSGKKMLSIYSKPKK